MVSQYPTPEWITEPPNSKGPYTQDKALEDLPGIAYALHLFLASHMLESEEYCNKADPTKCVVAPSLYDIFADANHAGNACTLQRDSGSYSA